MQPVPMMCEIQFYVYMYSVASIGNFRLQSGFNADMMS